MTSMPVQPLASTQAQQGQTAPSVQSLATGEISQADRDRKQAMCDAWKAYRGDLQDPLKVSANQPNDNVKTNRCAPIVDKGVSFLFGPTLKIECMDEAGQAGYVGEKQECVDGLWGNDDDKMTSLSQAAINGGVCGQVFLRLIPAVGAMKYPRVVVLDPLLIRIVTAPDDCSLTLAYIIEYPGANDLQKRQVIARVDPDGLAAQAGGWDLDDTWTITDYERRSQAGSWYQCGDADPWKYPFAPIFTCQNLPNPNEPWGTPDLTPDIIDVNRVLNFIQSNTSRILKFHAHPMKYGVGIQASQIQIAVDEILCLPAPDSKLEILEMHSDLRSSLDFIKDLRDSMDEQSRVPSVALGRLEGLPRGNISGVALQLLFQPLIEKTVQKQRLYGRLIREISRAALVLMGKLTLAEYEDYPIELRWQNLLPVDDLLAAQSAILLQQIGVSDATLMQQLGYSPDDEAEKSQAEDARKMTRFQRGQGAPPQQNDGVSAQEEQQLMTERH